MTHGGIPKEEREANGVYDDLVRVSVGIEDTEDLLKDIEQALQRLLLFEGMFISNVYNYCIL